MSTVYPNSRNIYLGQSDIAQLMFRFADEVKLFKFGGDGEYIAHLFTNEADVPAHYHKVWEKDTGIAHWCLVYDDKEMTYDFGFISKISVYEAGDYGIAIVVEEIKD